MERGTNRREVRAFRTLYQDHYGFVWSTVRRMGVRPDFIDDAVQDAFLVAFRRWNDLPRGRQRAWLYGIARRVSSNARRLERRRVHKHEALRDGSQVHAECGRGPETSAGIDRFLRTLDPRDLEIFVLGAIEGLTGKELAAALQAAPSTLHDRLQGLRRRFRDEVGVEAPAVRKARRRRPEASAASWALLLPQLSAVATSKALVMGGALVAASVALSVAFVPTGGADPAASPPAYAAAPSSAAILPVTSLAPDRPAVRDAKAPADPVKDAIETTPRTAVAVRPRGRRASRDVVPSDALSNEAALVTEIKRALDAGDAARARVLAQRHAAEHSAGVLNDAVVALHVEALCRLGLLEQAQVQARRHLRLRPSSPVSRRLQRGCTVRKTQAQP